LGIPWCPQLARKNNVQVRAKRIRQGGAQDRSASRDCQNQRHLELSPLQAIRYLSSGFFAVFKHGAVLLQ